MSSFRTLFCALALHSITMNKTKQDIRRFIIRVEIQNVYKDFTNIQNFVLRYSMLLTMLIQLNAIQQSLLQTNLSAITMITSSRHL